MGVTALDAIGPPGETCPHPLRAHPVGGPSTRWAQEQVDDDIPRAGHLLVEVAQTSLRRDLIVKAAIYAEAGIPEYWLIDMAGRRAVVHTDPVDGGYTTIREVVPPATLDACGLSIPLGELFAFAHADG